MKLIVVRHGEASWDANSDPERELTEYGRTQVEYLATQLKGMTVDTVLTSPYIRAQQTANIIAGVLGINIVQTVSSLTPDGRPEVALKALDGVGLSLAVSHMPLVSALTGVLCHGSASEGVAFATADAVLLEMEYCAPGQARLIKTFSATAPVV